MKSEALRNIKTMRQVKTSLDIARRQRPRTTNSLSKTSEETEHLTSPTDRRLHQILDKERRRCAAHDIAVNRSRQRVLKSREKLAMTVNRNRALTELRHKLQRSRWESCDPVPPETASSDAETNHRIELRY